MSVMTVGMYNKNIHVLISFTWLCLSKNKIKTFQCLQLRLTKHVR